MKTAHDLVTAAKDHVREIPIDQADQAVRDAEKAADAEGLLRGCRKARRKMTLEPDDQPTAIQIYGADPALLHSYSAERQAKGKELIDFDREWAAMISDSAFLKSLNAKQFADERFGTPTVIDILGRGLN